MDGSKVTSAIALRFSRALIQGLVDGSKVTSAITLRFSRALMQGLVDVDL